MDLPKSEIVCSGSNLAENFCLERSNFSIGRAEESAMSTLSDVDRARQEVKELQTVFRIMYIMFKSELPPSRPEPPRP